MENMNINITDSAQDYLADLLEKQDVKGISVRMFVTQPGTPYAETCLAYCRPDEVIDGDEVYELPKFRVYLEPNSLQYLEEAVVDYAADKMGGQLTIKAPNAKVPKVSADSPIEDQINYILYNEVNPGLAAHGGEVSLIDVVTEEVGEVAILKFGGGCQGCGMAKQTLSQGMQSQITTAFPEISEVLDATDHASGANPYY